MWGTISFAIRFATLLSFFLQNALHPADHFRHFYLVRIRNCNASNVLCFQIPPWNRLWFCEVLSFSAQIALCPTDYGHRFRVNMIHNWSALNLVHSQIRHFNQSSFHEALNSFVRNASLIANHFHRFHLTQFTIETHWISVIFKLITSINHHSVKRWNSLLEVYCRLWITFVGFIRIEVTVEAN
jgi:hypothetical protein